MHEGLAAFLTAVGLMTCIGTVAIVAGALCGWVEVKWEACRLSNDGTALGPEISND